MKPAHENRAYQQEIEDAIFNHWFEHQTNCIAASPGGTGKSFVMAKITKRLVVDYPGTRVMILAQDGKLLTQNSNELLRYWPQAPIGLYSSGLKQRDTKQPIIFAGIQSCYKRAKEFGERHIFLIDECDLLSPKEETMYQRFYEEAKEINPNILMAGLTATPYRLKEGCLTNLDIWDRVVIDLTKTDRFNWFMDNGFLKPLITRSRTKDNPTVVEIDVQNIKMKGGDFDEKELQEASNTDELNHAIIKRNIELAHNRKHWLGFVSGIEHGHAQVKIYKSYGISAVMLSAKDSIEYRQEMEAKFRSGEIRVLINFNLFIRGWDFPALDFIYWSTATQSVAKWVQGNLRGTRIFFNETTQTWLADCLVADYGGNIRRLGQINAPVIPKARRKGDGVAGEAPVRECPECFTINPIQAKVCCECGFAFPPPKTITKKASEDEILARGDGSPVIEDFRVLGIKYTDKLSKAGNSYVEVRYNVGTNTFKEVLMFGSDNAFLKRKIEGWWTYRSGQWPVPDSVEEALERTAELRIPSIIRVDISKKYPEVVGADWDENAKLREELTNEEVDIQQPGVETDDEDEPPF